VADLSGTPTVRRFAANRRRTVRNAVSAPLRFQIGHDRGTGVVSNVSTGGLFFKTDRMLPVGKRIQLVIDWPAKLETGDLRLEVSGKVLRSTAAGTALKVLRYEFRV